MNQTAVARSFDEWRIAARHLLAQQVEPHRVQWIERDGDLFCGTDNSGLRLDLTAPEDGRAPSQTMPPDEARAARPAELTQSAQAAQPSTARVPREMLTLLKQAACFRAPDRWAFLYQVLWRWQAGDAAVLSAADEDGARLHAMVKSVNREEHKMHAYLRFRERPLEAGPPRFIAWFEPAHDVLEQVAGHFARRMGNATWMIGTPLATVLWDGRTIEMGPPLMAGAADIDDAGEALWLTYYRSTFNPARLNVRTMQGHIPMRYWKNLPEGKLVPAMIAEAAAGASRIGQTQSVGARGGTTIPVSAEAAQPQREQPSTLDQCRRCDLWRNATQAVPGVGPTTARIMLVGEQPGDQEDLAGTPFIGPAGKLLDNALEQAGLDRESVYVTNAVKHFKWEPKGKIRLHKTPGQKEINACSYWLVQELAAVKPEVIVVLGSTALKAVLGDPKATLTGRLGVPFDHEGCTVITVYHPSYVLRVPGDEAKAQAMQVLIDGFRLAQAHRA